MNTPDPSWPPTLPANEAVQNSMDELTENIRTLLLEEELSEAEQSVATELKTQAIGISIHMNAREARPIDVTLKIHTTLRMHMGELMTCEGKADIRLPSRISLEAINRLRSHHARALADFIAYHAIRGSSTDSSAPTFTVGVRIEDGALHEASSGLESAIRELHVGIRTGTLDITTSGPLEQPEE